MPSKLGAALGDILDEPDRLKEFGGRSDLPEARRLAGRIGPTYACHLTGLSYEPDAVVRNLTYRTWGWVSQPTMQSLIQGLTSALVAEDGLGRMTSSAIDHVLKDSLPSWSLWGGKSRW